MPIIKYYAQAMNAITPSDLAYNANGYAADAPELLHARTAQGFQLA